MTRTLYTPLRPAAYTLAVAALTVMILSVTRAAGPFTGLARVIDGDTIAIGPHYIRLAGIDAPEINYALIPSRIVGRVESLHATNFLNTSLVALSRVNPMAKIGTGASLLCVRQIITT